MRKRKDRQDDSTAWRISNVARPAVYSRLFQRRKHRLTRFVAQDSPTAMKTGWRHTRACTHSPRCTFAALASLLALIALASLTSIAGATTARSHRNVLVARQSTTKINAKKKKKSAQPTIKMKLLGTAVDSQGILTDGERWAVYEPKAGVTRIMDTLTGKTIERPDPEGCSQGLQKIGGGRVLYECNDPECPDQARHCYVEPFHHAESRLYVIASLENGAQQIVPGTSEVSIPAPGKGGEEFRLGAIGSQWVSGAGSEAFFINLHTGQLVNYREQRQTDTEVYDLNELALIEPMCAPLTLEAAEPSEDMGEAEPIRYLSAEYDPPFAHVSAYKAGYGYLRRCGSGERLALTRCGEGGAGIGGGVLACGEDFITKLSSTRRYPWHGVVYRLRRLSPTREFDTVRHTATMIFAGVAHGPGLIYFARLPWAKTQP